MVREYNLEVLKWFVYYEDYVKFVWISVFMMVVVVVVMIIGGYFFSCCGGEDFFFFGLCFYICFFLNCSDIS